MQSDRYSEEALEERGAHVRMGEDRRGRPALVFSFPFDELLNSAVKRLPGRWFNWETREWTVLCRSESAEEIAEMLACFPRVEVDADVSDWLADAAGWQGIAAVWDTGDGPMLSLRLLNGVPPRELEDITEQGARNGSLLVPLDARVAEVVAELEDLELDPVADGAVRAALEGTTPPPGGVLGRGGEGEGVGRFELSGAPRGDAAAASRGLPGAPGAVWRPGPSARPDQQEVLAVPAD